MLFFHFSLKEAGEIWVLKKGQFSCLRCLYVFRFTKGFSNHLRKNLWNAYSKQISSTVYVEKCIPKSNPRTHGKIHALVRGSLGTDEFLEKRTITKKKIWKLLHSCAAMNLEENSSWQLLSCAYLLLVIPEGFFNAMKPPNLLKVKWARFISLSCETPSFSTPQ